MKMGASTSYYYSAEQGVKRIFGNSLPWGTFDERTAELFRVEPVPGDILLMISDGVLDTGLKGEEMEYWLTKTLADSVGEEARIIAERLLNALWLFSRAAPKMI